MSSTPQSASAPIITPSEIIVCIKERLGFTDFFGSRAMLEEAVLIPPDTQWPDAFDNRYWEDGLFSCCLRRIRPEGVKGARNDFINVDWWFVRQEPIHRTSHRDRLISLKKKELEREIWANSPEGEMQRKRASRAAADEKFQAFKALVPGLIEPRRTRRPKTVEQSKAVSA